MTKVDEVPGLDWYEQQEARYDEAVWMILNHGMRYALATARVETSEDDLRELREALEGYRMLMDGNEFSMREVEAVWEGMI